MKIKIHSMTDLITNSSTVIFTYSNGSEEAFKEMINEFFKTLGVDKTCDDVFKTVVLCEKYHYIDFFGHNYNDYPEGVNDDNIKQIYDDVECGKIDKPEWFIDVETSDDGDGFTPETFLHIIPKLPEYEKLGKLVKDFLYSTDHEATYNG